MKCDKRIIKILALILFFFSAILASCGPPAYQPWFIETIELDDHELPYGIEIMVIHEKFKNGFHNSISVSNSNNIPVYIPVVSKWGNNPSIVELDEHCPNANHCIKVLDNQTWEWIELEKDGGLDSDYDWTQSDTSGNSGLLTLDLFCGGIHSSNYVVQMNECKNEYDTGQGRPKNIEPPESQLFYLPYIFDGNEDSIRVTIHYSLNQDYKRDFSFEATGLFSICSGPAIGLIVVVLFASIALIINRIRKAK